MILNNYLAVTCQRKPIISKLAGKKTKSVKKLESSPNKISLLLEANLRFLSANLQLNSIVLNTLNNTDALDENQSVLNNLLNWLKSVSQIDGLSQSELVIIEGLKDSVRKAKSYDFVLEKQKNISTTTETNNPVSNDIEVKPEPMEISAEQNNQDLDSTTSLEAQETGEEENEQEDSQTTFFFRTSNEKDRWDYLANIQSFISSYEHLMHILMPNLVLEVVNELHRYDGQNKLIVNEAISYPSVLLQNMVTKFLREAPGSNLFKRIRRIKLDSEIDLNFEQAVNIGERKNIKSFVGTYFDNLTRFLDPNSQFQPNIDTFSDQTKSRVKQFSLGPASVEMRLTAVIKHVTDSALKDAEEIMDNENALLKTKIIYLATTQLICDFQNFLLAEPRIVKFLEDLKS